MMVKVSVFAVSHVGRRKNNEDSFCVLPELGLFAVADGMGGYHGGEVASQLALSTIIDFFQRNVEDAESTWPFAFKRGLSLVENMVEVSVRLAHRAVLSKREGALNKMGTTLAMFVVDARSSRKEAKAIIGHVGDSRVYRMRDGVLTSLTVDHSLYEQLKSAGMSLPSLDKFAHGNVITRAIGIQEHAQPDLSVESLQGGDRYLLCTDGLTGPLSEELCRSLLGVSSPKAACESLVQAAYDHGGKDNITAVVLDVESC